VSTPPSSEFVAGRWRTFDAYRTKADALEAAGLREKGRDL
jgi:hypothetical protein